MKSRPEREKAALCGCGLLENVADLSVQRCRRTRRDPSSSNERRRKAARSWVRFRFMAMGHTAEGQGMSRARKLATRLGGNSRVVVTLANAQFGPGRSDDLAFAVG